MPAHVTHHPRHRPHAGSRIPPNPTSRIPREPDIAHHREPDIARPREPDIAHPPEPDTAHPPEPDTAHHAEPDIAHHRESVAAHDPASDVARQSTCETNRREKSNGSAHPQRGGQARGPAPTGSHVGLGAYCVSPSAFTLGDIVQRFKSLTTARYRRTVTCSDREPYPRRLWQRNYYERIIRDDGALDRIRRYIRENPRKWRSR